MTEDNLFPRNPKPPEPEIVFGSKPGEPVKDWRLRYVTLEEFKNVPPPSFIIENFLEHGSITAIGAPVAQRKSIVVANMIRSTLTGEPLFGNFKVVKQPKHVIYLCPEMGLIEIADRFKRLGLQEFVGSKLFIRSMEHPKLKLTELCEELPDSLLILDTITRFVEGDQNSADDMAKFADLNYAIKRQGATIVLLHHATKRAGDAPMSLDSALRGSTELAAFVTCVWTTQLEDIDAPHTTPSLIKCVKQRGFPSKAFQVSCDDKCLMHYAGELTEIKAKKDEKAETVIAELLKSDPKMGINRIQAALKGSGCGKGAPWIKRMQAKFNGTGVTLKAD